MRILLFFLLFCVGCSGLKSTQSSSETIVEQRVRQKIQTDGVHVVHFWAPWCSNSINEMKQGWYELVENYADSTNVDFTFVTVWNNGESGRAEMDTYAIPENVVELKQADFGNSELKANRRYTFMGLPLTWIPSTWVFNRNGKLAYAFNYGEQSIPALQQAIEDAKKHW